MRTVVIDDEDDDDDDDGEDDDGDADNDDDGDTIYQKVYVCCRIYDCSIYVELFLICLIRIR